jgi:hypothetical protein
MLRFVPPGAPVKLVNSLFQVNIRSDQGKSNVTATQRLPETDPDPALAKKVELFAFPDPCAIERGTFLTFLIRDGDAFQIGFALYYSVFSAFCILSDYYYPRIFRTILRAPYNEMIELAAALTIPDVRQTVTVKRLTWPLDGSRERQALMKLIFTTFPPYDIAKIVIGLIQNRHLFVVATSAQTCSAFVAALSLLIEPFRWDNASIPLLPLQIMDMIQSPMPILVGLTRPELLDTDMVSAHVCVNCDIKLVMDSPVFEEGSPVRLKILAEQMKFAQSTTAQLQAWKGCRGFPHEVISAQVQRFISQYLQIYTGPCASSDEFIQKVGCLPEHVLGSQVFAELTRVDELDAARKAAFIRWFGQVFARDMAVTMKTTVMLGADGMPLPA